MPHGFSKFADSRSWSGRSALYARSSGSRATAESRTGDDILMPLLERTCSTYKPDSVHKDSRTTAPKARPEYHFVTQQEGLNTETRTSRAKIHPTIASRSGIRLFGSPNLRLRISRYGGHAHTCDQGRGLAEAYRDPESMERHPSTEPSGEAA